MGKKSFKASQKERRLYLQGVENDIKCHEGRSARRRSAFCDGGRRRSCNVGKNGIKAGKKRVGRTVKKWIKAEYEPRANYLKPQSVNVLEWFKRRKPNLFHCQWHTAIVHGLIGLIIRASCSIWFLVYILYSSSPYGQSEDIPWIRTGEREYATRFGEQFPRDTAAGAFHTRRDLPQG